MSTYNPNSGYGRRLFDSLMQMKPTWGQLVVVCKTGHKNFDKLQQIVQSEPNGSIMMFETIAAAVTYVNARIDWGGSPWANQDRIVIFPGVYAENLTSLPYGGEMIGMGDCFDLNGERGVTIKPASGSPVDVTSCINARIENIAFESPDTSTCFEADNFNRVVVENCLFSGLPGSSPTTVYGFRVKKDMTGSKFKDCIFQVFNNGIYLVADNANSKQITGDIFDHCYIRGCDTTGIYFDANCVPAYTMINDCVIGDGTTTLALGLDDNAGGVMVTNTMFEATACDPASTDADSSYNHCYLNGALIT
jgi:hypothetical protein